eukprot:SAG11_NODE_37071_length_258_cov_1.283019_1_plen_35_part_01
MMQSTKNVRGILRKLRNVLRTSVLQRARAPRAVIV